MNLDFRLTESEEILKTTATNFLKREITKETLEALHESETGFTADIWRKICAMGWLGMVTPEEYGGTGYPLTTAGVLFETLGSAPLPGPYFSSGVLGSLIVQEAGTEAQKKDLLPRIADGTALLVAAVTESEYGWQPEMVEAKGKLKSGDYVVNGVKLFIPDAGAATHFVMPLRTGRNAEAIALFVIDRKYPGVSVRPLPGYLNSRSFEVKFDEVTIPPTALLGKKTPGWRSLMTAVGKAIPVLCAYKVGGCQAVLDMAADYSRVRMQFGQAIGRFQRVQDMIIDLASHVEAARWSTYEALWKLDTQGLVPESVHLAKAVTSEAYWQVCILAHRAISGISYSTEHPLSLHTRASRYLYHFLGDPAFHKQQLARLLLQ
jgi:alkylation response protein AidB-like acyl-CoA dehydrogenase